jgi:hypothetical protein
MTTNIINFPRRAALKAITGGLAGELASWRSIGEVAAKLAGDPLVALGAEWQRLNKEGERLATAQDVAMFAGRHDEARAIREQVSEAWDRVGEVEQKMAALTATTPEGLIAQARTLRDHVSLDESEAMLEQILVGLAKLTVRA